MSQILKPSPSNLPSIKNILIQWTDPEEVEKYLSRIEDEINNKTEFNQHFWIIKFENQVAGVGGLADPLPKTLPFATTKTPGEIKILYLDNQFRGHGLGKELLSFLETEARNFGYTEILIRTALRYKTTAWDFYQHQNYKLVGYLDDSMAVFQKLLQ